jgi:hypothetical protein
MPVLWSLKSAKQFFKAGADRPGYLSGFVCVLLLDAGFVSLKNFCFRRAQPLVEPHLQRFVSGGVGLNPITVYYGVEGAPFKYGFKAA